MATKPVIWIMTATLALGGVLAGCSGASEQSAPQSDDVPEGTATKDATPTPDGTPTETPEVDPGDGADGALPVGFPDPGALVGQVVHDEAAADGSWHTVVGGAPLTLVNTLGACFDGGSGDICGYSVSASVPAGTAPQPATAALVLLLRSNGALADGTPTWVVLDAVATTPPGGGPAYVESCDGTDGVVVWADTTAATADPIPVLAAWGPDATASSLVEVDPASLSCPRIGG